MNRTHRRLIAALGAVALLAVLAAWAAFYILGSTPCGIEGQGFLRGTRSCPLRAAPFLDCERAITRLR
jgi:hypothetical protein